MSERLKDLRETALLCCHFVRNYAYYCAMFRQEKERGGAGSNCRVGDQYWLTIQSNFLDIAILEWVKLAGAKSKNELHHWKKIIKSDQDEFESAMLLSAGLSRQGLCELQEEVHTYRDKFIAHLDKARVMVIPDLRKAALMVEFYYKAIFQELTSIKNVPDSVYRLPKSIEIYREDCFSISDEMMLWYEKNWFDFSEG